MACRPFLVATVLTFVACSDERSGRGGANGLGADGAPAASPTDAALNATEHTRPDLAPASGSRIPSSLMPSVTPPWTRRLMRIQAPHLTGL